MNKRAAQRYAQALFEAAEQLEKLDVIFGDMQAIGMTLAGSRELRTLLASPIVKPDLKLRVLEEIFAKQISTESMKFIKLLVKKNRENLLMETTVEFRLLHEAKRGILHANVESAVELRETERAEITTKLEAMLGKKITPTFTIDPAIRGGFVARIGDTLIDASLRHQLEILREQFRHGGSAILN
jgi:F-type H+-transporting ATPase subunit delta